MIAMHWPWGWLPLGGWVCSTCPCAHPFRAQCPELMQSSQLLRGGQPSSSSEMLTLRQ